MARRRAGQPEIYARCKSLAEHPFGTIRSIWGYGQFMVKGAEGCEGELNLIAFAYNPKKDFGTANGRQWPLILNHLGVSFRSPKKHFEKIQNLFILILLFVFIGVHSRF